MSRELDELKKEAIEEAWANEINRRHSDYKLGRSAPISADIVFEEIEKTFGQL